LYHGNSFFRRKKKATTAHSDFDRGVTIAVAILWFGVIREGSKQPLVTVPEKKIEINLSVLENPILSELELFKEIAPFDKEAGRENPFLPYSQ
jgi:hypothetical protein